MQCIVQGCKGEYKSIPVQVPQGSPETTKREISYCNKCGNRVTKDPNRKAIIQKLSPSQTNISTSDNLSTAIASPDLVSLQTPCPQP